MSYPFTATSYTNLNIVQNGNFKEYSLQLANSGNISFNTDITLNFTLVGGGGGGGGGGHNNGAAAPRYPSGGGGGGGAAGTYKIDLYANDSHIYFVGSGGFPASGNNQGQIGQSSYIDFQGSNFATELNLNHSLTGPIDFVATGLLFSDGYFHNTAETQRIAGAVSFDATEAGYFFERQLEFGNITGLTLWNSQ